MTGPNAPADDGASVDLLRRGQSGDLRALEQLIEQHRGWLWSYVRRRMGSDHRRWLASEDVVQDTFKKLLERGPRFVPRDENEFRRFVATIVVHRLHDLRRRNPLPEAPARSTVIGRLADPGERPDQRLDRHEERALVHLALELVDPEDAVVVQLRTFEAKSHREIGDALGTSAEAARARCNRALRRLGLMMRRIEAGALDTALLDLGPRRSGQGTE